MPSPLRTFDHTSPKVECIRSIDAEEGNVVELLKIFRNFWEFSLLFGLGFHKFPPRSKVRDRLGTEKAENLVKVDRFL